MVRVSLRKKIKWLVGIFLICTSVLCVHGVSPARAELPGISGYSGTCVWKYEAITSETQSETQNEVSYEFTISPISNESGSGTLDYWNEDEVPPWNVPELSEYSSKTMTITIASADGRRTVTTLTCANMFKNFNSLERVNLLGLDVSGVTNMSGMFSGCSSLSSVRLDNFDTGSVGTMRSMFENCKALRILPCVANWNTSNVVDMSYMFSGCSSLSWLKLCGWSTSSNPKMVGMFDTYDPSGALDSDESLVGLCVGEKFRFGKFSDTCLPGSLRSPLDDRRFSWFQVDDCAGSIARAGYRNFPSFDHVVAFHNDRQEGFGFGIYVRSDYIGRVKASTDTFDSQQAILESIMQEPESTGESRVQERETPVLDSTLEHEAQGSSMQAPEFIGESSTQESSTRGSDIQDSHIQESSTHSSQSTEDSYIHESSVGSRQGQFTGWRKYDCIVFYYRDGERLTGWQELAGTVQNPSSLQKSWFYFSDAGVMLTGRQNLVGGFKNARGIHEPNEFFFDTTTGAEIRGWHKIVEGGVEKWYYYRDGDGIMLKGQHELVGGCNQRMNWFYFDEATGIQIRGWKYIDYQDKWCYYSGEDGTMLKGQYRLYGGDNGGMNWFYFDEVTGAELRNCWKEIPSQSKTCYYGSDGAMYKGWREVDGRRYYFDEITGARM